MPFPAWTFRSGSFPTGIGDYEIACSQLCGLGHYRMRGFISVKTDAEYQAGWLKRQGSRASVSQATA